MTYPRTHLSRRGFCMCCLASATFAATGGWLTPREVFAQARSIVDLIRSEAAKARINVHQLRGNVSVLEGSGGNVAVLTGGDGTLLVDAGITASQPRIIEALRSIGAGPIRQLINTHWHFDHTDGNEWVHAAGAAILAHENTRKHLASAQRVEDWNFDFPAAPSDALPSEMLATDRTLRHNGATLELRVYQPAHTDGDISVYFSEADILHTGDTWWNGIYPFIDYSTGGSINGMINAAEANLGMTTDKTIIVPGHGRIGNRAQLTEFHDMLVAIRDNVAELKAQGKSLAETQAAKPTAAFDAKWGQFVIGPDFFTHLVYAGI
ncbi:MBL fold metallo-hydrolase [Mesorhizobium tianshanense]|uniref:Glyoxylase-like metal-dependent hydrolase (Beta-lactamase superfamily II) n=1 Tax=Mesorhizobium tianshanense TaxID=39844 RepID=A0A562N880_9HYPH|nr:MBL fold metallo-hydrolase [Mesorhizobium tianshanense]TWI28346.1 glyoxylase-like metal-dependent hydrolase (beta-lactamase superfamily II) [Mesorhizobium tianshanense]